MTQFKKTPHAVALSAALALFSGGALADHGSLGFGIGTASPIITQPGVTLPSNMWAAGIITQFSSFNSASDQKLVDLRNGPNPDVHSISSYLQPSIFGAYGLTDDLTFGVKVPYVFRTGVRSPDPDNPGSVNTLGDPHGFGDVSVFTQYRFFHSADNLNHLALTLGLKTPTGQTAMTNNQGPNFETHHQPGSGSWNPSGGLSYTRVMGSYSFDTNVLYTIATRGARANALKIIHKQ